MSTRRRYRYNEETHEMEEVGLVEVKPRLQIMDDTPYRDLRPVLVGFKNDSNDPARPHYVPQFKAIDSKTKHHQHMKENGLALAQDFEGEWARKAEERAALATASQNDKTIREDIERAMYRVFDAPGIEQNPTRPTADGDKSAFGEAAVGQQRPPDPEFTYEVVNEYLPHGK